MAIQLTGLASGLDWKTLVSSLIEVQKIPLNRLELEKSAAASKSAIYNTLKDNLTALKTSLSKITNEGIVASRSANIAAANTGWSASAASGADLGSYTFTVTQLATQTQRQGAAGVSSPISDTNDVSGVTLAMMGTATAVKEGSFTVNGAKVEISLTDSLQDVFDKISAATGGEVTASYDSVSDKITLQGTGPIVLGSGSDTSNFLTVAKLYNNGTDSVSSQRSLGALNLDASIKDAKLRGAIIDVNEDGKGIFSINGVTIPFDINTDSIRTLLNRITGSEAGVAASYDAVNDRFVLTNKATGNTGLNVSEDGTGILSALGLTSGSTYVAGKDAIFSVNNGGTLISSSNTLSEAVHGIRGLSVTATTESTQTVNVGSDVSGAKAAIQDFIAKYNALQTFIDTQTRSSTDKDGKVTTAALTGDLDVSGLARTLRGLVFNDVSGIDGSLKRLNDLGIDFNGSSSQLLLKDPSKLEKALADDPNAVADLLTNSPNGVVNRLTDYIDKVIGANGMIATKTQSLTRKTQDLEKQIERLTAQIAQEETRLTNSFIAMETAQSALQNQLSALIGAFGGN